ncbi:unnamed protein product [Closterium sp. Naga37s-1]|nr:unnamed protein product [Closterium sp. Naga37s-1]
MNATTNQARSDISQLWNLSPSVRLPVAEWERPGCILTLDSRYNPEGVLAVEAAVARLLRDLGAEATGVVGPPKKPVEAAVARLLRDLGAEGKKTSESTRKSAEAESAYYHVHMGAYVPKVVGADGNEDQLKMPIWVVGADGNEDQLKMPIWVALAVNM